MSSCTTAPQIIKIGLVAPFEGAYRSVGYDAIYAARLAVREINSSSVSEGWALELVAYDDRAESEMAITSARNLVTDPDVLAVIGHYYASTTASASPLYTDAGLPLLVIGDGPESPNSVYLFPPPHQQVEKILEVITMTTSSTVVWGEGQIASDLSQQLTSRDIEILSINPEEIAPSAVYIFSTLPALQTAEHLLKWSMEGWQGLLVSSGNLNTIDFARMSGNYRNRACFITPYPAPDDIGGIEEWKRAYINIGPHVSEPGPYALPTYEIIHTLAEIIDMLHKDGLRLNRQHISTELAQAKRTGTLGTISFDAYGYWDIAPLYLYCWKDKLYLVKTIQ